jgi:hypothetical protein
MILVLALTAIPAAAPARKWGRPRTVFQVTTTSIPESSGIAPSRTRPGSFYTHNDSGDTSRFFRINLNGREPSRSPFETFGLANVTARDWEDMATARIGSNNYIYIGDIGDNSLNRTSAIIYRVVEPTANSGSLSIFDRITITYPFGSQNCECLMVHPTSGDIWIVNKVSSGASNIFRLAAPTGTGTYSMSFMGTVHVGGQDQISERVTGGAFSPDGKWVVLRTRYAAYEFAVPANANQWFTSTPTPIVVANEAQGEAICYSLKSSGLYTTSEGSPFTVSLVPTIETATR